ncbi:MAG: 3-deoxy-7-phosphoheptulonate synthase, partial [Bacteroidetes bacterium]
MIIQLDSAITPEQQEQLLATLTSLGQKPNEVRTSQAHYLVSISKGDLDPRRIGSLPGVRDVHIVNDPYQLVSSKWRVHPTLIDLGDNVRIGGGGLSVMAGPCSIESEAQVRSIVAHLVEQGISIMRGGVFKPRSSPYSFRGMGIEGLQMWYEITRAAGIRIISEVMQVSQIEPMLPYVDIFQVGARNTQNFNLLDALGEAGKPVLLKRGISGTVEELLNSAEYIFS